MSRGLPSQNLEDGTQTDPCTTYHKHQQSSMDSNRSLHSTQEGFGLSNSGCVCTLRIFGLAFSTFVVSVLLGRRFCPGLPYCHSPLGGDLIPWMVRVR